VSSASVVRGPRDVAELLARARAMAGRTVGELAAERSMYLPRDMRHAKGLVGILVEHTLGVEARDRSTAAPDFEHLGVELKTIPLDRRGRPRESTFVCHATLARIAETDWERSDVRRKLARVLWVPIESERELRLADRRIGAPLLWSPTGDEEAALRADWEELAGLVGVGAIERIDARMGHVLQLRPKAAHGRVRTIGHDEDGAPIEVGPRAFYLRATFTERIFGAASTLPTSVA